MPGDLHECFLALVSKEILGLLSSIVLSAQTPTALAHLMREVIPKGSPNRQLGDYRRAPGLSFGHRKVLMPGLVVEFAHSQKSSHLRHLAYDYIVRSKGKIQAVLGLDLEYGGGGKAATISLWRAKWETHADGRPLVKCNQELTAQVSVPLTLSSNPSPSPWPSPTSCRSYGPANPVSPSLTAFP